MTTTLSLTLTGDQEQQLVAQGWTAPVAAPAPVPVPTPIPISLLAGLQSGTACKLGAWSDTLGNFHRSDYSCVVADPANHRVLFYGGGHSSQVGSGTDDDIRAFDLGALTWSSLYAPTPDADLIASNEDLQLGRWISTNHPIVRHTFAGSVVTGGRYYLFQANSNFLGALDPAPICWYDFAAGTWTYSASGRVPGWQYNAGVTFDPVSQKIVVCGTDMQASGWYHLWLYDPATDVITKVCDFNVSGHMADMHYDASSDSFLLFGASGKVMRLALNRAAPAQSTLAAVTTTGVAVPNPANAPQRFAFDGTHYGGSVIDGTMYLFDAAAAAWSSRQLVNGDGSPATFTQIYYCIDFDPTTGCYIVLGTDSQTYACRP